MVTLKPNTALVLRLLRERGSLTQIECLSAGGGMRLSGRILELRQAGLDIETKYEGYGSTRYARYILREQPQQLALEVA